MFVPYWGMARRSVSIKLKPGDLVVIEDLLRRGVEQVRVVLRALALRSLAGGLTAPQVAQGVSLTAKAVREIAHRYNRGGLDVALYEKQRPGAKEVLDASQKQRIIAMVCGDPPEGRARWTVRLVTQEAVKRKLVPRVGRETIRVLLESHDLKPWRKKNVVRGRVEPRLHPEDGRGPGRV
jgi:transposase